MIELKICWFTLQNVIEGNHNVGNHQSNADVGVSLSVPVRGGWFKYVMGGHLKEIS